jgi:transcriptional regulator with XRE-family HTH domain
MNAQEHDYQRLAEVVRDRRLELGMTIAAVAEAASMSKDTYKRVEAAQPIRETNYVKIDKALHLAIGSCIDVLGGAEIVATALSGSEHQRRTLSVAPETAAKDAVVSAVIATNGSLTAAEISDLSQRIVEELKDRGVL